MNTPEWIEYTGGDEQLTELLTTDSKFMVDNEWSVFHKPTTLNMPATEDNLNWLAALLRDTKVKNYLICQPHPYADLIKIWADTGCPVWVRPTKPYEFEISDYENHPTCNTKHYYRLHQRSVNQYRPRTLLSPW